VNLDFSAEDQELRANIRAWLTANVPTEPRPEARQALREYDLSWQRRQYEGGWAGIAWPAEYGGLGLTLVQQLIWHEEYARAHAPDVGASFVGLNHGGPTLIAQGSEEQQAEYLPAILRGEVVWCQGFSEPEAGSDLGSLRTYAEVDGDMLVVNGQKIWTSYADVADYMELLVRTDRTAANKHQGISWVVCDMRAPGIDVRPIRTAAREDHFGEVFFDDVRIPLVNVVGVLNHGWRVAMSTLGFERGTAFMSRQIALAETLEKLIDDLTAAAARRGESVDDDTEVSRALADLRAEVSSLRAMTYVSVSRSTKIDTPGPEGSMIKLYYSEIAQRIHALAFETLGPEALEFVSPSLPGGWTGSYMKSFANSIGGGTSEIQRNIIAERVLGLPR
jgi:alkylation response protein AidB-like acyl-CoA dehydrogenase